MITIFLNNFTMFKRLVSFQNSIPKLYSVYSAQYHSLIPQQSNLTFVPKPNLGRIINNEDIENINIPICPQSIIVENIYECRNKRHEQARRKRLKRKNGTKNKVRWT